MVLEIISETPIDVYKLKEELQKIKKRDKELNFRSQKTEEHLASAAAYISRLREQHIHKIIDVMPATVKDLKVVLQGYTISVSNENMKKIVDTTKSFVK